MAMKNLNIYIGNENYQVEVRYNPLVFYIRNVNCAIPYKIGLKDDGTWFRLPEQQDGAERFDDEHLVKICAEIQTYIN